MRPAYPARSAKRQVIQWCLSQSGKSLQTKVDGRVPRRRRVTSTICDGGARLRLSRNSRDGISTRFLRRPERARCPSAASGGIICGGEVIHCGSAACHTHTFIVLSVQDLLLFDRCAEAASLNLK